MRLFHKFILAGLAVGLIGGAGAVWEAGSLYVAPAPYAVGEAPEELHAEKVAIPSGSGSTLQGWLVECPGSDAAVALFHGVGATRLQMKGRAKALRAMGYSSLMVDFQAHGESPGKQITFGHLEAKDVEACIGYLHTRFPNARLGAVGVSMGGAALALAEHPLKLDAVVLELAYSTIDRAVLNRMHKWVGGLAPAVAPLLTMQLLPREGFTAAALRPVEHLSDIGCPILIAGGAEDSDTEADETHAMFAAAKEPKELWIVPKAGHVDLFDMTPADYGTHVFAFLARYLKPLGK